MSLTRILWAEDNPSSFQTFKTTLTLFLEGRGITAQIVNAVDGNAVFRLLPLEPWDLVVVDIKMPHYGGLELIEDLSVRQPTLRKVVVSDHTLADHIAPKLRDFVEQRKLLGAYPVEPREAWCTAIFRAVLSRPPIILHISDVHFGRFHALPENLCLEDLLLPFLAQLKRKQPIDAVAVTGDLCSHGTESEFRRSSDFLEALLNVLQIGLERLIVIPGNHDIHRASSEERRFGN